MDWKLRNCDYNWKLISLLELNQKAQLDESILQSNLRSLEYKFWRSLNWLHEDF